MPHTGPCYLCRLAPLPERSSYDNVGFKALVMEASCGNRDQFATTYVRELLLLQNIGERSDLVMKTFLQNSN